METVNNDSCGHFCSSLPVNDPLVLSISCTNDIKWPILFVSVCDNSRAYLCTIF